MTLQAGKLPRDRSIQSVSSAVSRTCLPLTIAFLERRSIGIRVSHHPLEGGARDMETAVDSNISAVAAYTVVDAPESYNHCGASQHRGKPRVR